MNQSPTHRPPASSVTANSEVVVVPTVALLAEVTSIATADDDDFSDAINAPLSTTSPAESISESPMTTNAGPAGQPGSSNCSPHRRCRLQRSERLQSGGDSPTPPSSAHSHSAGGGGGASAGQYSSWEVLIRDSFGQIAWPIKFTSWELIDDNNKSNEPNVPTR